MKAKYGKNGSILSMNTSTINREASDKTKGFRLQKLRATNLALDELEKGAFSFFYIAIEQGEDVAKISGDTETDEEYYEEDKDYPTSNFSINSPSVKNTLVSFYDLYAERWRESNNICFGFYTTAEVGKENATKLSKALGVTFPKEKLIDLIRAEKVEDSTVEIVKKLLVAEYETQYDGKNKGNLERLKKESANSFRAFLKSIRWFFGKDDNEALKEAALIKIRKSQFFNYRLDGKEEYILSVIEERIEERQHNANYSERFIDKSQIELIFNKAESIEGSLKQDFAWKGWDAIEVPDDTRILKEKIYDVCSSFDKKEISRLTRRACTARFGERESGKDYLSLKYRVLEACEEIIYNQIGGDDLSQEKIGLIIDSLRDKASASIEELKKDFHYPVNNSHSIKSIVLDLFDSCYLSFD